MTSMVEIEQSDSRSEGVGEKRPAAEDMGVSLIENEVLPPPQKRIKRGGERDLKKVAEMVLVLSAMGKMRGGGGPTVTEKELMGKARNRLAKVCENFAPKDVFPKEVFGSLIDDLGLNKLNEQRIGFRPPKISIAEKLLISKRKMEKAEDLSLQSTPQSAQQLQKNSGAAVESHSASHSVQKSHLGKSNHMSISALPLGHVTPSSSTTPLPYQLPTSEIRPTVSTASPSSHLGVTTALPRVNRQPTNGPVQPSQVQVTVNHSANSATRTPTWTVQHHPAQPANVGSNNKVPTSLRVGGPANVKSGFPSQATSRTVITQTAIPPSQGTNSHLLPWQNAHAATAKIVQKLLQPKVSDRPIWDPPSRDYMNKAVTCQMCTSTVTDTDSILICDACEKGHHLKCLQVTYQKSFAGEEWHCGKCLSFSHGKPLPPKYGRVMRNTNTPKMSSDSPTKRIDASDDKVPQPKITFKGDNLPENVPTGVAGNNSGSKREDVKEIEENANYLIRVKMDDISNMTNSSLSGCVSTMDSSGEKLHSDEKTIDTMPNSSAKSKLVPNSSDKSQPMVNGLLNDETSPSMQSMENNNMVGDFEDSQIDETLNNAHQPKDKVQEGISDNPSKISTSIGVVNRVSSSPGGLRAVSWVGDPTQVLDEKIFYGSCRINEHLYKAMDYVLVRFEDDKIIPSKLQAMWEDKNTTMKWVTVNQCYFPSDLPEAVGRPCCLQSREVYESTKGTTLMAGLIESPCEVLPPRKFVEEIERSCAGTQPNDHLPPLYLCKWIYDEAKGLFRDISC